MSIHHKAVSRHRSSSRPALRTRAGRRPHTSQRGDLLLARADRLVEAALVLFELLVDGALLVLGSVLRQARRLDGLLDLVDRVAPDVAQRGLAALSDALRCLGQLDSPVLRQLRHIQPDDGAVVGGRHPDVGRHQPLLDVAERGLVVHVHHQLRRRRTRHRSQLLERRRRVVVVDEHAVQHVGRRAADPQRGELLLHRGEALLHPLLRVAHHNVQVHLRRPAARRRRLIHLGRSRAAAAAAAAPAAAAAKPGAPPPAVPAARAARRGAASPVSCRERSSSSSRTLSGAADAQSSSDTPAAGSAAAAVRADIGRAQSGAAEASTDLSACLCPEGGGRHGMPRTCLTSRTYACRTRRLRSSPRQEPADSCRKSSSTHCSAYRHMAAAEPRLRRDGRSDGGTSEGLPR
mmetsp:Transcript_24109/g.70530  ORF Transcript_24109/g.70530 Transcript_24109/m.70530 type:complete len:405 (+) Transcript_24109:51-1265(+)